ncbi:MAG TPA: site-specific DNA-methyltransferase [Acidobacteriaceae bacterium]|nr:site-specific DNA-methyltransferase [Acidobacteriaceae bacterium]
MENLRPGTIDLILCDLPYGVTDCSWDRAIPFEPLWQAYGRLLKENGAALLFAQQPFSTQLAARASAGLKLRYEWIWDKGAMTGFQNANRMPMRRHENVLVFYRHLPTYNPQGVVACAGGKVRRRKTAPVSEVYGRIRKRVEQQRTGFPGSIIAFHRERNALPCQKPVALLEYLIRTYSNQGEVVLDNCMGTGSAGIAAVRAGRAFIGMEMDAARFALAQRRIGEAQG